MDVYLIALLELLDRDESAGSSMSISLMVGGTLVCGDLISHDRWQTEFQQWMRDVGGDGEFLSDLFKGVDEDTGARLDGELLYFVHLRNAQVITNYRGDLNVPMGSEHRLWRGRLTDVQGWTMGRPA